MFISVIILTVTISRFIIGLTLTLNERGDKMISNTKNLRQLNKSQLLNVLKTEPNATKNKLAKLTGLSVATCGNILKDCIESGEVFEIELGESTGGRPSRQFIFNKNHAYIANIYPRHEGQSTSIAVNVNNLLGQSIYTNNVECDLEVISELDDIVTNLIKLYPNIKVLSFGIPGVVDHGIVGVCDIEELIDFKFQSYFEDKFNLSVTVDNDVNLSAIGFYSQLDDNSDQDLAYIYFPLDGNPGAGIIVNGQIINGFSNFAGEVSYMPSLMSRHKQGNIQQNPTDFATYVSTIIMNINCVINPKTIVLAGYCFSVNILQDIKQNLIKFSRVNYVPNIQFEEDLHDSYLNGLIYKGLKQLKEDKQ